MKKPYDSKFKSRVTLEVLRGELTVAEIAGKYQIHPQQWESNSRKELPRFFCPEPHEFVWCCKSSHCTLPPKCLCVLAVKVLFLSMFHPIYRSLVWNCDLFTLLFLTFAQYSIYLLTVESGILNASGLNLFSILDQKIRQCSPVVRNKG